MIGVRKFETVLIANRGEIAVRINHTARRAGYKTVAVYSDPDINAPHVSLAHLAIAIGGSAPKESYLDIRKILDACETSGADAVHPGYGFLSENAEFARACEERGLIFIGPSADAIEKMGSKSAAKELMIPAGVPCIPGYQGAHQEVDHLLLQADRIGFPLMVKAAAGGGGRGLRLATTIEELPELLKSARQEAEKAFNNGELLLERAIVGARHVEIQVFGDAHGNVVHLGERDCSVQRRHQKVFEEAPSPAVTQPIREAMGQAAVRAARAINYVGAGTVEFLLDRDGKFYFMEMNTRLQVEHPVTELITGFDLVQWQLDVAAGKPLPKKQEEIRFHGHAIEARLYAEDPLDQFRPQVGTIHVWEAAGTEVARTDHGLKSGTEVSPYYDAMLAKIICWGEDRETARRKLICALADVRVLGVKTNRTFLIQALRHQLFADGQADTSFVETALGSLIGPIRTAFGSGSVAAEIAASIFTVLSDEFNSDLVPPILKGWSSNGKADSLIKLKQNNQSAAAHSVHLRFTGRQQCGKPVLAVSTDNWKSSKLIEFVELKERQARIKIDQIVHRVDFCLIANELFMALDTEDFQFVDVTYARARTAESAENDGIVRAPSNGLVSTIEVSCEQEVSKGQLLCSLESMKLIQAIAAPVAGVVSKILVSPGTQVSMRQPLIEIAVASSSETNGADTSNGARSTFSGAPENASEKASNRSNQLLEV